MLRVHGSLNNITLATDENKLLEIRAAAERAGVKDLVLEQSKRYLYGRSIFMGYDLPNGNGDGIPSFFAGSFGPSFIGKRLDYEHLEDEENRIGEIMATWHITAAMPAVVGPRIIGRNVFGHDTPGRQIFRMAAAADKVPQKILVEGIWRLDMYKTMGSIVAGRLRSGELKAVSQEAQTGYCMCPICAHRIQFHYDAPCEHLRRGSIMAKSYRVDGYEDEILAFKMHQDPVGDGLGIVKVPAFDEAQISEITASLKSGQMTLDAALELIRRYEDMLGIEADRNRISAATHDFELAAADGNRGEQPLVINLPPAKADGSKESPLPGAPLPMTGVPKQPGPIMQASDYKEGTGFTVDTDKRDQSDALRAGIGDGFGGYPENPPAKHGDIYRRGYVAGQATRAKMDADKKGVQAGVEAMPVTKEDREGGLACTWCDHAFEENEEAHHVTAPGTPSGMVSYCGPCWTNEIPVNRKAGMVTARAEHGYLEERDEDVEIVSGPEVAAEFEMEAPEAYQAFITDAENQGHGANKPGTYVYLAKDSTGTMILVPTEDLLIEAKAGKLTAKRRVKADRRTPEPDNTLMYPEYEDGERIQIGDIVEWQGKHPSTGEETTFEGKVKNIQGMRLIVVDPVKGFGFREELFPEDITSHRSPKVEASLFIAIEATTPTAGVARLEASTKNEELAERIHAAAVLEARLNCETASLARHAVLAQAFVTRFTDARRGPTAARIRRLVAAQTKLDASKDAMAAAIGLKLPKGAPEGSVPAWCLMAALSPLQACKFGSPAFQAARREASAAMPAIQGFHSRLSMVSDPTHGNERLVAAGQAEAAFQKFIVATDDRRVQANLGADGKLSLAAVKVMTAKTQAFMAALTALATWETKNFRRPMQVLAATAELTRGTYGFAAKRLRLPADVQTTVLGTNDRQTIAAFAAPAQEYLSKIERQSAVVLAGGSQNLEDRINATMLLARSAFDFKGSLRPEVMGAVKGMAVRARRVAAELRVGAQNRSVIAVWNRVFDINPLAIDDPRKFALDVAAAAKVPYEIALLAGRRLRAEFGGMWPTGNHPQTDWPTFLAGKEDTDLEAMLADWSKRLEATIGVDAKNQIEANIRRVRSTLELRKQAQGCRATLINAPDVMDAYWLFRAADGKVLGRLSMDRILGNFATLIQVKQATSKAFGAKLEADARILGAQRVCAGWDRQPTPGPENPVTHTQSDIDRARESYARTKLGMEGIAEPTAEQVQKFIEDNRDQVDSYVMGAAGDLMNTLDVCSLCGEPAMPMNQYCGPKECLNGGVPPVKPAVTDSTPSAMASKIEAWKQTLKGSTWNPVPASTNWEVEFGGARYPAAFATAEPDLDILGNAWYFDKGIAFDGGEVRDTDNKVIGKAVILKNGIIHADAIQTLHEAVGEVRKSQQELGKGAAALAQGAPKPAKDYMREGGRHAGDAARLTEIAQGEVVATKSKRWRPGSGKGLDYRIEKVGDAGEYDIVWLRDGKETRRERRNENKPEAGDTSVGVKPSPEVQASPAFDKWIDTFVSEKGIDPEETFEVEGPSGPNTIPYGVIIEHMKIASPAEQAALKNMIVKLDFLNKPIEPYLKHLGQAIAASWDPDGTDNAEADALMSAYTTAERKLNGPDRLPDPSKADQNREALVAAIKEFVGDKKYGVDVYKEIETYNYHTLNEILKEIGAFEASEYIGAKLAAATALTEDAASRPWNQLPANFRRWLSTEAKTDAGAWESTKTEGRRKLIKKRVRSIEAARMRYTGDIDKDFDATDVDIIAEVVAEKMVPATDDPSSAKQKQLATYLGNRARTIYKNNADWGMKLARAESSKAGARDQMYMWMEHWAEAWTRNGGKFGSGPVDQDGKPMSPEDVEKGTKMARERQAAVESLDKEFPAPAVKAGLPDPDGIEQYGIYNGIDDMVADPRVFTTRPEADAALQAFKDRYKQQGFYRSADGYQLPLTSLDADGEGGGVFVVERSEDPTMFDEDFGPDEDATEIVEASAGKVRAGDKDDITVARWESRGKKYWFDLYTDGNGSYFYKSENGNGNFGKLASDEEAVAKMQAQIDEYVKPDIPSMAKVAASRVQGGITQLPSGRWRDTNGNSYATERQARIAEDANYGPDIETGNGGPEYPKRLPSGRWKDENGNSYATYREAAGAQKANFGAALVKATEEFDEGVHGPKGPVCEPTEGKVESPSDDVHCSKCGKDLEVSQPFWTVRDAGNGGPGYPAYCSLEHINQAIADGSEEMLYVEEMDANGEGVDAALKPARPATHRQASSPDGFPTHTPDPKLLTDQKGVGTVTFDTSMGQTDIRAAASDADLRKAMSDFTNEDPKGWSRKEMLEFLRDQLRHMNKEPDNAKMLRKILGSEAGTGKP